MEFLNLPMMLIVIGALLSAFGAFLATYRQNQEQIKSANQRVEFESALRAKSDEIAELNKTIAASITGGDSFCYYSLTNFGTDSAIASVLPEGNYPLYDVVIRIADVEDLIEVSKNPSLTVEEILSKDKVLNLGNLSGKQAVLLGTVKLPHSDNIRYSISITARNGMFGEEIRLKKVKGVWKSAMKVTRINSSGETPDAPDTLLKEFVDPDFPRNKDGQVDWE